MREKTFLEKYDFYEENFCGLLAFTAPMDATPPNFTDKTFTNTHKTAKFMKVFSLESFPLYGICQRRNCRHYDVTLCVLSHQRWLVGQVVTKEKIDEAAEVYAAHLRPGLFNYDGN